jgi:4-hydroxy-tetrahydrodipicolinate synthase
LIKFWDGIEMKRGVYCVLQTPLNVDESINQAEFAKEIDWLIQGGVSGVVLAMVSEVMRFSADERRFQWKLAIDLVNGRVPLIISVGAESTVIATKLATLAEQDGASALMATPPAIFPATADEIFNYYRSIIEATQLPVIVQDASNYMGKPLGLELYEDLLKSYGTDRVQFKPEARPVKERAAALQKIANGKAKIFEGQSGADLLETHPIGVVGTMPGSEIPWAIIKLWSALENNNTDKAIEIHSVISKLLTFQPRIDSYVAVEKYLLVKQGIFSSTRQRGPVSEILSSTQKSEIDMVFEELVKVTDYRGVGSSD